MISSIDLVSLYVADQERSRAFYADTLGFTVTTDVPMGPQGRWIEVAPPGGQTGFILADAAGFGKADRIGNSADVTFKCADVRELHRDLVAKGVPVTEPETKEWGSFIKFTDPDGHQFVVSEK
ncbi:MAG: VOC family protein [Nocardiopsaceae bacterium]|nr:VOC family protein [Nocardiopsaceae bacterium]